MVLVYNAFMNKKSEKNIVVLLVIVVVVVVVFYSKTCKATHLGV